MKWTNPGLVKAKNYDVEHFMMDFGIRIIRFLHPLIHMSIRIAVDRPVDDIRYPNLPKGKNYIFAAGHFFPGRLLPISA